MILIKLENIVKKEGISEKSSLSGEKRASLCETNSLKDNDFHKEIHEILRKITASEKIEFKHIQSLESGKKEIKKKTGSIKNQNSLPKKESESKEKKQKIIEKNRDYLSAINLIKREYIHSQFNQGSIIDYSNLFTYFSSGASKVNYTSEQYSSKEPDSLDMAESKDSLKEANNVITEIAWSNPLNTGSYSKTLRNLGAYGHWRNFNYALSKINYKLAFSASI